MRHNRFAFFLSNNHIYLLWANILGYVSGQHAESIIISITNSIQTSCGALDIVTKELFIRSLRSFDEIVRIRWLL